MNFRAHQFNRGFALVATISILSLAVLLALALLSLATVSTKTTSKSYYIEQARANARLALAEAISVMQTEIGPDQRITAWSNIYDENEQTATIEGVANRHLLGVWDAWTSYLNEPEGESLIADTYHKGRSSKFRRWLVSGGETLESLQTMARSGNNIVKMVAQGTIGEMATKDDIVYAKKYSIHSSSGDTGSYAWWVGSENLKANLSFRTEQEKGSTSEEIQVIASEIPFYDPRGQEAFKGFPEGSAEREKLISNPTIQLIRNGQEYYSASKGNYFNFATNGQGILTDVKSGGTKIDLNLLFERDAFPDELISTQMGNIKINTPVRPIVGNLPAPENPHIHPSDWRHFRDYYRLYKTADHGLRWDGETPYTLRHISSYVPTHWTKLADTAHYTRLPVLLRFSWVFGLRSVPNKANPKLRDCYITGNPIMVFWNPYNVEMRYPVDSFRMHAAFYKSGAYHRKVYVEGKVKHNWSPDLQERSQARNLAYLRMFGHKGSTNNIIMKPGEILMFTPHAGALNKAFLGYDPALPELTGSQKLMISAVKPSERVEVALRFATERNLGRDNPQNCFWWGLDRSGTMVLIDDSPRKDGVYHWGRAKHGFADRLHGEISTRVKHMSGVAIDWLEDEDTYTEIVEDNPAKLARVDMASEEIVPMGVVNFTIKTAQKPLYSGSNKPKGAKDFRNKNWLHSQALTHLAYLQQPNDVKRGMFPYQMQYQPVAGMSLSDVIQEVSGNAFSGGGHGPANGVSYMVAQELPTAPVTSLAAFGNMPLIPARVLGWDIGALSKVPSDIRSRWSKEVRKLGYSWKTVAHSGATYGLGIGNGYAHPMIPLDNIYYNDGSVDPIATVPIYSDFWDLQLLTNDVMWDKTFCSSLIPRVKNGIETIPQKEVVDLFCKGEISLYNSRLKPNIERKVPEEVATLLLAEDGYKKAGAFLSVDGAFNVNSTSVEAWKALLRGLKVREIPFYDHLTGQSGTVSNPDKAIISRARRAGTNLEGTGPEDVNSWRGIRMLTDTQIDHLAEEMVKQVKLRGPFLNMSDFINRRLEKSDLGVASALQAAIDWDEFNVGYDGTIDKTSSDKNSINHRFKEGEDFMITDLPAQYPEDTGKAARGSRYTGIAGYVMASDILQGIGNILTPRCDTFTVRAYGEAKDSNNNIIAIAYCEALISRSIDYMDPSNDMWEPATDGLGNDLGLTPDNLKFGRRLKMINFKWLTEQEI